jgi:hypothetical protein
VNWWEISTCSRLMSDRAPINFFPSKFEDAPHFLLDR